jgi:MFS family permease
MGKLLAHRDARIYMAGQALSMFGDNALWLAMAIWVKILTGSNSAAGLTFLAFLCGSLLAPVAGVIADRARRRSLLIVANLASAVLVCLLLLAAGRGQLWLIYLVMFGYGALGSLVIAAQTALLAVMLPDDLLGEANAALQVAEIGLRVVTPLAGAGLLAWAGPKPVILLDAGTFVAAGLTMLAMRLREPRPLPVTGRWRAEFTAGIRHVGRTRALRRLLVSGMGALLVFGFFQVVPFAVVGQGLHRRPVFLGVLEALLGAGALAGGVVAAPAMRRTSERALVIGGMAACSVACLLLITSWLPVVLAAMALVGVCIVWVNVAVYTLIQRSTPLELLGRVDAALSMAMMIPQAVSIALGAVLIGVVNYRILLIGMAVVFLISAALMLGGGGEARAEVATAPGQAEPAAIGLADGNRGGSETG